MRRRVGDVGVLGDHHDQAHWDIGTSFDAVKTPRGQLLGPAYVTCSRMLIWVVPPYLGLLLPHVARIDHLGCSSRPHPSPRRLVIYGRAWVRVGRQRRGLGDFGHEATVGLRVLAFPRCRQHHVRLEISRVFSCVSCIAYSFSNLCDLRGYQIYITQIGIYHFEGACRIVPRPAARKQILG